MINLFRALNLKAGASPHEVRDALHSARQHMNDEGEIDGLPVARMEEVLGNEDQLTQYRRVHDQYVAIGDALALLDLPGTLDSHRWRDRTVEFLPE